MANDTNFIDSLLHRVKMSLHTFLPARVIAFYPATQEADLEILFMQVTRNGTHKYPMIQKAPVLGMRFKSKNSYSANITGLIPRDGSIDGSGATIQPTQEIEYVPFLKAGDVVFCGVSERAIDNLQKVPFDPKFSRTHDPRDIVVIGIWGGL
jgi:hypothetical protein